VYPITVFNGGLEMGVIGLDCCGRDVDGFNVLVGIGFFPRFKCYITNEF